MKDSWDNLPKMVFFKCMIVVWHKITFKITNFNIQ